MIQRIQTVYLALVAVLSILGLCLPLGQILDGATAVASFNNWMFSPELTSKAMASADFHDFAPMALGILLLIVIALTFVSILLFRFRMRQLRLTIFSTILLVGYVLYFAFLAWHYTGVASDVIDGASFHLCVAGIFPVLSVILNCLAIHGIRKDEALVRSLDRLR